MEMNRLKKIDKYGKVKFSSVAASVLALVAVMSFVSCDIETSDNGKLDGFWHLEQVDTLATGGTADFSERYVFWGVQKDLIFIKDSENGAIGTYYLRFAQTSDSLHVTKAFLNHGHEDSGNYEEGGDLPVEEVNDDLRHLGLNDLPEHFVKETLNSRLMVICTKKLRLKFRRF